MSARGKVNMEKVIRESTTYTTPEKIDEKDKTGIVSSESTTKDSVNGGSTGSGTAGTESNADTPQYNAGTDGSSTGSASESATRDYLVNQVKEQGELINYVKGLGEEKDKILEKYIDDLKNIALSIGEKIVQTSLKTSEDVIERMILAATEKLKKAAWAKIYIGSGREPLDIQGDAEFLHSLSKLADSVKVIMMDEEEKGTCIVELPDEIIDISVGAQLENIKEILNNARL